MLPIDPLFFSSQIKDHSSSRSKLIIRLYFSLKIRPYSAFPILFLVCAKTRIALTVIKYYQAMTRINKMDFCFGILFQNYQNRDLKIVTSNIDWVRYQGFKRKYADRNIIPQSLGMHYMVSVNIATFSHRLWLVTLKSV